MSKKYLLGVVLGLFTLGVQLEAKVYPDFDMQSLTGHYASGADRMTLSINDLGQVEGFYIRAGVFGEISGTLVDGIIAGSWMESFGDAACSSKIRDYSNWGPVEATLDNQGFLAVRFVACGKDLSAPADWKLQRAE